jgi:DNA mismatch endonuclease (patch repair protein)
VPRAPSFDAFTPASDASSGSKRLTPRKNTKPELLLRHTLWRLGLRYRTHVSELPGCPDIVFTKAKLAVFCDGDFWHGRGWRRRRQKLKRGSNSSYWLAKIRANRARDRKHTSKLQADGWTVLRLWETDIVKDPINSALIVLLALDDLRDRRKE